MGNGLRLAASRLLKKTVNKAAAKTKPEGVSLPLGYVGLFSTLNKVVDAFFQQPVRGAWCSTASTSVSKTEGLGSIPSAPAMMSESVL